MPWWAWLLVDLFVVVVAAGITGWVGWRTWKVLRLTMRRIAALDIPKVERPLRE
jgi:hypothetical protein